MALLRVGLMDVSWVAWKAVMTEWTVSWTVDMMVGSMDVWMVAVAVAWSVDLWAAMVSLMVATTVQ